MQCVKYKCPGVSEPNGFCARCNAARQKGAATFARYTASETARRAAQAAIVVRCRFCDRVGSAVCGPCLPVAGIVAAHWHAGEPDWASIRAGIARVGATAEVVARVESMLASTATD